MSASEDDSQGFRRCDPHHASLPPLTV